MAQKSLALSISSAQLVADVLRDYLEATLPAVENRVQVRQALELLDGYQQLCRYVGNGKDATWAKGWANALTSATGAEASALPEDGRSNGSHSTSPPASPPSETGSKARRSHAPQQQEPSSST